jgi:signal transduction histidine kinase/CheY-like chemotaxis protein
VRILLIEDNPGDALLVQTYLEEVDTGIQLENVTSLADADALLERSKFDALLVDLSLPDAQGLETVRRTKGMGLPVVVMTGQGDEETALAAVQAGAQDYLVKGRASGLDIRRALRYAVERVRLSRELSAARERAELLSALGESLQGARSPLDIFTQTSQRISDALALTGMSLWHNPAQKLESRWSTGSGAVTLNPQLEGRVLRALSDGETWFQMLSEAQGELLSAVKPVPDAATKPIAVLVVVRSIQSGEWLETERDLLQSAAGTLGLALERADLIGRLETSNAKLEVKTSMALEAAKLVAWEWEIEADRLSLSSNASDVLGSGAGQAYIANAGLAHVHPNDLAQHQATVANAVKTRQPYRSVLRLWHTERRQYIWIEEYGVVRESPSLGISGVTQDINDRRIAQDALIDSQQRLELALESAGMGTWDWQLETGEVLWGGHSDRIFGYPPGTNRLTLSELMPRIHVEDRKRVEEALDQTLTGGDLDIEYRVVWPDESVHYVLARGRVVRDSHGKNVSVTGTNVDLTQIKRAEAALRRVNEAQKRFVGDAAHELRAPLTSIQGNLGLLRRYENMQLAERRAAVEDAYFEASRLGRLVTDMLALARGDSGEGLRRAPLHFDELLSESLRQASHLTTQHRLEIGEFDPCVIEGDRDRLKQLALILLENALKYTPPGGFVRVSLHCNPEWSTLTVTDSGVGIAPEDLAHVFERFYRADKGRARGSDPGGTGLGLPIAQWIVAQHGGEIKLESTVGVGTTATVKLPIAP